MSTLPMFPEWPSMLKTWELTNCSIKTYAMCDHVYVVMHVGDPQLSLVGHRWIDGEWRGRNMTDLNQVVAPNVGSRKAKRQKLLKHPLFTPQKVQGPGKSAECSMDLDDCVGPVWAAIQKVSIPPIV